MNNAKLADLPVFARVVPRPSTVRRIEKLRTLVAALSSRDMGYLSVATVLGCSPSSSRQYLAQLADAGVVTYRPGRRSRSTDGGSYRLSADAEAVRIFLSTLTDSVPAVATPRRTIRPGYTGVPGGRYVHVMDGETLTFNKSEPPVRRDPLVVALFGEAAL